MSSLSVMLVPTSKEFLLFPASMVTWVFPYAPPLTTDESSEFVIGGLLIQTEKLPLLDFTFDVKEQDLLEEAGSSASRIVLVSTISVQSSFRHYAILAHGSPEVINVNEDDIKSLGKGSHRYIAQKVEIANCHKDKPIFLPNLVLFESELTMS